MEYLADDELLECTPKSLRIRKRTLDHAARMREVMKKAGLISQNAPANYVLKTTPFSGRKSDSFPISCQIFYNTGPQPEGRG